MPKMADAVSHLLGKRMVNSSDRAEPRKTPEELAAMDHFDRLHYEIFVHPETSSDREARYIRETTRFDEMEWWQQQLGPNE
jgi:hypothetical protein